MCFFLGVLMFYTQNILSTPFSSRIATISTDFVSYLYGENLIVAVDDDGCFTSIVSDFAGRYVKDADKDIVDAVKVRLFYL